MRSATGASIDFDLTHTLTFTGPRGQSFSETTNGGTITVNVVPGNWEIDVVTRRVHINMPDTGAGADIIPDAVGHGTVEARIGQNNTVAIQLFIANPAFIGPFLFSNTGGAGGPLTNAIDLNLAMELNSNNWGNIFIALNNAGNYVNLNLSRCTRSGLTSGSGLQQDGTFDPGAPSGGVPTNINMDQVVSLILPEAASTLSLRFVNFNNLRHVNIGNGITDISANVFSGNPLTRITIGANKNYHENAFPLGFWAAYTQNNFGAGTYIRPSTQSTSWVLEGTPIITITTHPAATTSVAAGNISGSLSVAASVTLDATLNYQWFTNTTNSNVGGTPISGATSASFNIPTALPAGTYYYFAEVRATGGAVPARSSVARVFVSNISPTGIEMMRVAGGEFELGRELGALGSGDETPVSTVTLTGFHMSRFPVTQAQFQAVMTGNNNGISPTPSWFRVGGGGASLIVGLNTENFPVDSVSWYDAIVFCNLLSMREGLTSAYRFPIQWPGPDPDNPAHWSTDPDDWGTAPTTFNDRWNNIRMVPGSNGYRLPTEAQWEYAAKGGNTGELFTFSGSNDVFAVAWHDANSGFRTREVGGLAPNGLGIHDMSGNVYEWCWDWWGNYTPEAKTDPPGPVSGTNRVLRGGSWMFDDELSQSVDRAGNSPGVRDSGGDGGFRVVRP